LVDCDLHKIEQVFWNLLDNAIKYAPQGSEIAVVLEKTKAGMRVSFSNRGCFLDRSTCDLIFDKNFVFDARTPGARGLGLFISKLIIESHDGKIWADVDGGSFKISFDIPC
jgi:signal transduction histidine kinase